ncbi:MAG: type VII toxin-antitoxin system HepT family RNase toxin [Actinomycetota bacterium]
MVDPRAIRIRLKDMEGRLLAIRQIQSEGKAKFLTDKILQAAAERNLQLAIQGAIDIALHIVAEDSSMAPKDYVSSFGLLTEVGLLEESVAAKLASAARLRNILVHAYLEVDQDKMWQNLDHLADLEEFAISVDRYLGNPSEQ